MAEDYFLHPPEDLPADGGLEALLDEAFLAHRLLEEVNDHHIRHLQRPLLPLDMTEANIIVHHLLGDDLANALDQLVHETAAQLLEREHVWARCAPPGGYRPHWSAVQVRPADLVVPQDQVAPRLRGELSGWSLSLSRVDQPDRLGRGLHPPGGGSAHPGRQVRGRRGRHAGRSASHRRLISGRASLNPQATHSRWSVSRSTTILSIRAQRGHTAPAIKRRRVDSSAYFPPARWRTGQATTGWLL